MQMPPAKNATTAIAVAGSSHPDIETVRAMLSYVNGDFLKKECKRYATFKKQKKTDCAGNRDAMITKLLEFASNDVPHLTNAVTAEMCKSRFGRLQFQVRINGHGETLQNVIRDALLKLHQKDLHKAVTDLKDALQVKGVCTRQWVDDMKPCAQTKGWKFLDFWDVLGLTIDKKGISKGDVKGMVTSMLNVIPDEQWETAYSVLLDWLHNLVIPVAIGVDHPDPESLPEAQGYPVPSGAGPSHQPVFVHLPSHNSGERRRLDPTYMGPVQAGKRVASPPQLTRSGGLPPKYDGLGPEARTRARMDALDDRQVPRNVQRAQQEFEFPGGATARRKLPDYLKAYFGPEDREKVKALLQRDEELTRQIYDLDKAEKDVVDLSAFPRDQVASELPSLLSEVTALKDEKKRWQQYSQKFAPLQEERNAVREELRSLTKGSKAMPNDLRLPDLRLPTHTGTDLEPDHALVRHRSNLRGSVVITEADDAAPRGALTTDTLHALTVQQLEAAATKLKVPKRERKQTKLNRIQQILDADANANDVGYESDPDQEDSVADPMDEEGDPAQDEEGEFRSHHEFLGPDPTTGRYRYWGPEIVGHYGKGGELATVPWLVGSNEVTDDEDDEDDEPLPPRMAAGAPIPEVGGASSRGGV
jgi:hypothetical protein